MKRSRTVGALVAVCASVAAVRPATPQEAGASAMSQSFGISSSLRSNDNFGLDSPSPGTTTLWDNTLTYDLLRNTSIDQLSLRLSGILRFSDIPEQSNEFDFDAPSAVFNYGRTGANSLLGFGMLYSQIDLNFDDPLRRINEDLDDVADDNLILDDGTRETTRAGLDFEFGVNDPIGAGFSSNYANVDYTDTVNSEFFDRETIYNEVFGRASLSPVLESRLSFAQQDYDADDAERTNRTSRFIDFSLSYDVDPTSLLEATIGYADIDETEEFGEDTRERGMTGNLGWNRDLANGSAGFELETNLSVNGRRDTILFNRALGLPLGYLEASLGATRGPLNETNPIGILQYSHEGPRTRLWAEFERSYGTNDRSEETRSTRALLGYEVTINTLSLMRFTFDYASAASIGDGSALDNKIGIFRTAYVRKVTEDWDISAGYEHREYESETDPRTNSNEVFFTLSRRFTTR